MHKFTIKIIFGECPFNSIFISKSFVEDYMKEKLKKIINKKKLTNLIVGELVGRFAGFAVAMWTTKMFSKVVYEKKDINNLYGLLGRKKMVVNTTPEWLQWLLGAIVGFLVLELVDYIIEQKIYLKLYYKIINKAYPEPKEEINTGENTKNELLPPSL
ncbi:MAG: hypothetical protein SFY32_10215 [Bacteroidota bacterium]|nr:hypothetical protein [Bacteroidota bacterium]